MAILNVLARVLGIRHTGIKITDKNAKNVREKILHFAYGKTVKEKINKRKRKLKTTISLMTLKDVKPAN